jgi:hypothetical protein
MALTGNEIFYVQGVAPDGSLSPVDYPTTTGAVAALAAAGTSAQITNTAINTVGNGVLTAAGLIGGQITRTGSVAAYTDTTDTAANIVAALPSFVSGATFFIRIKNSTAFTETIAAGVGVTMSSNNIIGAFQEGWYFGAVGGTVGSPTITIGHMATMPIGAAIAASSPLATTQSTVGAATLTAASIASGVIIRAGSQSNTAFTDTTGTAAGIMAATPALVGKIGGSFFFWYINSTNATATLTGGTGVTVSGITTIPGGTWALYLVTSTGAAALNMVGLASTNGVSPTGTFVANGATAVVVAETRVTANSCVDFGLKTIGGTPAGAPFLSAVTAGTGFSVKVAAGDTSTYNYTVTG